MKTTLSSPITVASANCAPLITVHAPAGRYRFVWDVKTNSLEGNGGNGQLSVGFGDLFVGSTGGPSAAVLSSGKCQFVGLSPDGSELNGVSDPLIDDLELVTQPNVTAPLHTQILAQVGEITMEAEADVTLYYSPSAFDGTDKQDITDATLILEPVPE